MQTPLFVCLLSVSAFAQISGIVLDPTGAPVPGARVASGDGQVFTDTEGRFRLNTAVSAPISIYKDGFTPVEKAAALPRVPLTIRLRLAEIRSEITVAESQVDTPQPNLDIQARDLILLPTASRDVISTLAEWIGPMPGAGGGLSIVVDGVETPVAKLSPERIAEVKIGSNPFSAEFTRPGSSRIEIRTKPGSEKWRGSIVGAMRDSQFDARPAFANAKPRESANSIDATLAGPLGAKTTLLLSAELEHEREQALVVARTLSGDIRTAVPSPDRDIESRLVITRGPITLRYEEGREHQINRGVGGFRLPELAADATEHDRELQLAMQKLARGWLSETQARVERETLSVTSRASGAPRIEVNEAFASGSAQADESRIDWSARLSQIFSHSVRKHYVRLGIQSPEISRVRIVDNTGRDGVWRFASLDDYARGTPYAFEARTGNGLIGYAVQRWGAFIQDEWRVRPGLALSLGARYDTSTTMSDRLNFAPRAGLAFRLSSAFVFRAGAGLFYDFLDSSAFADTLRFDGTRLREILLGNPSYPLPDGLPLAAVPPNVVLLDATARAPQLWEGSLSIEHRMFSAGWRRSRGHHLFRAIDSNAPPPGAASRPDAGFGQIRLIQAAGRLAGDAAHFGLTLKSFRVQAQLGRILSDTEGAGWLPANSRDPRAEWGYDNADRRWRVQAMTTIRAPHAFRIGLIWRAQGGAPYTLRTGRDDNADGVANDRLPGIARNTLRGTTETTADVRLGREFRLPRENASLECALDAFNVLNRVNYRQFVGVIASPFFGQPVAAASPRRLQLTIRARF